MAQGRGCWLFSRKPKHPPGKPSGIHRQVCTRTRRSKLTEYEFDEFDIGTRREVSQLPGLFTKKLRLHHTDMDVGMHVWRTAEMDHRAGAFDSPDVPNAVAGKIIILVEGEPQ